MKNGRLVTILTLVNFTILSFLLLRPPRTVEASGPLPVLRGSGLEIVDAQGKVRASFSIPRTAGGPRRAIAGGKRSSLNHKDHKGDNCQESRVVPSCSLCPLWFKIFPSLNRETALADHTPRGNDTCAGAHPPDGSVPLSKCLGVAGVAGGGNSGAERIAVGRTGRRRAKPETCGNRCGNAGTGGEFVPDARVRARILGSATPAGA